MVMVMRVPVGRDGRAAFGQFKERGLGSINISGIADGELDGLIREARVTLDAPKRRAMLEAISEKVVERNWVVPVLAFGTISAGRADKVTYATRADEETMAHEIRPAK